MILLTLLQVKTFAMLSVLLLDSNQRFSQLDEIMNSDSDAAESRPLKRKQLEAPDEPSQSLPPSAPWTALPLSLPPPVPRTALPQFSRVDDEGEAGEEFAPNAVGEESESDDYGATDSGKDPNIAVRAMMAGLQSRVEHSKLQPIYASLSGEVRMM